MNAAVDALVRAGDLAGAADRLEADLAGAEPDLTQYLKLAGLRRALRQPRRALKAVEAGLVLAPLDFMGLVMRAGLLENMGDPTAGRAWDEALAQRPEGDLPPPLLAALKQGEGLRDQWRAERAASLAAITQGIEAEAQGDEAWRMARFRSNTLRQTRAYHCEPTHFHYPGLSEREFHPAQRFPWLDEVAAATDAIRAEMLAVMQSDRAELAPYIQYAAHQALRQWQPLNHNPDWTAIHLIRRGEVVAANAAQCPATMDLLSRMPQPDIPGASANALFSLLAPNTAIPPHVGVSNARLLCHVPLVVPDGCWFRVGAETRMWREGEPFIFDDTIEHEAMNPSPHLRVVMIFDIWHPDLTLAERDVVRAIVAEESAAGSLG